MPELKIIFVAGENKLTLFVERQQHIWDVEAKLLERLSEEERAELTGVTFRKYWLDEDEDRVEIMNDDDYNIFLRHAEGARVPKMYFEVRNDGLVRISAMRDLINNMAIVRINDRPGELVESQRRGYAVRGGVTLAGLDFGFNFSYDYTD